MKYFILKKAFKRVFFVLFVAAFFITSFSYFNKSFALSEKVRIKTGMISGIQGNDPSVIIFKGIPYAAPPVGDLRWKAPEPPAKWEGVKACDKFGANAMQALGEPFLMFSKEFLIRNELGVSEDCLTLNVWTSKTSTDGKRPVVMDIHGGAFNAGSGSCPVYDGEGLAKKGVVFVTINYRVGIFGFMSHPELSKESLKGVSGNYGLLDIIAALKWIKENIKAFGGDPSNVTIQGQSAGSLAVHYLIMSPLAKGLFKKAIAQSFNIIPEPVVTLASEEAKGISAMKAFGKASLTEMRAMTAEELQRKAFAYPSKSIIPGFPVTVVTDGYIVPDASIQIFKNGKQNDVDLITGHVTGDAFMFGAASVSDMSGYYVYAKKMFGALGLEDAFLAAYPADGVAKANAQITAGAVHKYNMLIYGLARARAIHGKSKTYMYYYTHVMPTTGNSFGAFHSSDVPYFYNYFYPSATRPWTQVDYDLGNALSSYIANFARTGNPNGSGLVEWPAYDASGINIIEFGDKIRLFQGMNNDQIIFWNKYLKAVFGL